MEFRTKLKILYVFLIGVILQLILGFYAIQMGNEIVYNLWVGATIFSYLFAFEIITFVFFVYLLFKKTGLLMWLGPAICLLGAVVSTVAIILPVDSFDVLLLANRIMYVLKGIGLTATVVAILILHSNRTSSSNM